MRTALAVAMLLGFAITACDRQPTTAEPTPREKMTREYTKLMKTLDLELEGIANDLKAGKPADAVRIHVDAIQFSAEKASKLPYRTSDAENRDLAFEFRTFLDVTGKLRNANWAGDDGMRAYRQLSSACAPCHQLYRPD